MSSATVGAARVRSRRLVCCVGGAVLLVAQAACEQDEPRFCDEETSCSVAGHTACDLAGVCPASEMVANTCIRPEDICWDAGVSGDATSADAAAADGSASDASDAPVDAALIDGTSQVPDAAPPSDPLALRFGGSGTDRANGLAVDAAGNMYIVGAGSGSFGDQNLGGDMFTASYQESMGTHRWSAGYDDGQMSDVAVDDSGDIYVIGSYGDAVPTNLGGDDLPSGGQNIFLAKYDGGTGAHIWSRGFNGPEGPDSGIALAIADDGNVIAVGEYVGALNLGGGALPTPGLFEVFVAKFSASDGSHIWSRGFGSSDVDNVTSVRVSGTSIYVTGSYRSATLTIDSQQHENRGSSDGFVAKFDDSGDLLWSFSFGGSAIDIANDLVISGSTLAVVGQFQGTAEFGDIQRSSNGLYDAFLSLHSPTTGQYTSVHTFGAVQSDRAQHVAVDATGNFVVGGNYGATVDFGGGNMTSNGVADIWIAGYDTAGSHLWSKSFGGSESDAIGELVTHGNNVVIAGGFRGTIDFDAAVLTSFNDNADAYLVRF